jgi:hypothetical protein
VTNADCRSPGHSSDLALAVSHNKAQVLDISATSRFMPYGIIILAASIVLVAWFDFATEASWISKGIVSGLFLFCIGSLFGWIHIHPLVRLFLLVALSIFIIFYRTLRQGRPGK